jgi:hypothetical protein
MIGLDVTVQINEGVTEEIIMGAVQGLIDLAHHGEATMKRRAPSDTGRYRSSIGVTIINDFEVHIGPHVEYAPFVEEDTRPHEIRPKGKAALRFEPGRKLRLAKGGKRKAGDIIFAGVVKHPGTKGQHIVRQGAEAMEQDAADIINNAIRRELSG